MRQNAQSTQGASTVRWGYGLKHVPGALRETAAHYRAKARAAGDHPMNAPLRESLNRAAAQLEALAGTADRWFPLFRTVGGTAADMDAYEAPRDGSVHSESRADAGKAFDGN